jgi:hypothetical protein
MYRMFGEGVAKLKEVIKSFWIRNVVWTRVLFTTCKELWFIKDY